MPAEFDTVAFGLEAGKVSDVVRTKAGFEIIKVWERKPERQRDLTEVSQNIHNSLVARRRNEKRREVLRDLKNDAKVEQLVQFRQPTPAPSAPPVGMRPPTIPRPGTPGAGLPGRPGIPGRPRVPSVPVRPPQAQQPQ